MITNLYFKFQIQYNTIYLLFCQDVALVRYF